MAGPRKVCRMNLTGKKRKLQGYAFGSVLLVVLTICGLANAADVTLGSIFTDHMVLQRDKPIKIWGWADAGQTVSVAFAGASANATPDAGGKWMVALTAQVASKVGRTLTVTTTSTGSITRSDVLVGDVWHYIL